jgi:prevent-host-death family protein
MTDLTTDQKGNAAEAAVVAHAVRLGIEVYMPFGEGGRFDMLFVFPGGEIARVQSKWSPLKDGVIIVRPYSTRRTATGLARRGYGVNEIDAIAAYCSEVDRVYYLPRSLSCNRSGVHLRVAPTRNGQRGSLNWAAEYELGAVAQLGERRHGMAEARGSSPLSSTPETPAPTVIGAHEFRNRFGWYAERASRGEDIMVTRRGRPYVRLAPGSR